MPSILMAETRLTPLYYLINLIITLFNHTAVCCLNINLNYIHVIHTTEITVLRSVVIKLPRNRHTLLLVLVLAMQRTISIITFIFRAVHSTIRLL